MLDLYWPHTRPFDKTGRLTAPGGTVLQQNKGGQAEVLTVVAKFRASTVGDATAPISIARARAPGAFEQLVRRIEFKLIEMPLGKLQVLGSVHDPFIYELDWDRDHPPRWSEVKTDGFDGILHLRPQAASHMLRAAGLIRPLVQREWALTVSSFNDELLGDDLDEFLFGAGRISLQPVRADLRELAAGRCFYCGRQAPEAGAQIDHFLPWTRHIDNGLANLVYTHATCNNAKRAHLAAEAHLERWVRRLVDPTYAAGFSELAARKLWDYAPGSSVSAARGIYLALHDGYLLWQSKRLFTPAESGRIAAILNVVL